MSTKKDSSANIRKDWINSYKVGTYLDQNKKRVSYYDFIYKELVLFSIEDCSRSIPSLVDRLKPGQRKILFACFKRKLTKEIRVAQLAGYVSEVAAYHHGEASLQAEIVGMAQNFVGSNNINVLHPQGQSGTWLEGGKDASSARYIHTYLSGLARVIFHPSDDGLLDYLDDDGLSIEPRWYINNCLMSCEWSKWYWNWIQFYHSQL
jgi:DNA topoisomerase-2